MIAPAFDCPDLIDRCVAGERTAWRELHALYRPQVLAFLRRLGVEAREADDACQEIFLQVFRYLPGFERRADFRTWLYKLCLSQAGRLRRRARLLRPLAWLLARGERSAPPDWSPVRAHELAEAALAMLSVREREVFVLFELEGLPTAEIAHLLGCPAPTVRRLLHDARGKFERFVRDQPLRGSR